VLATSASKHRAALWDVATGRSVASLSVADHARFMSDGSVVYRDRGQALVVSGDKLAKGTGAKWKSPRVSKIQFRDPGQVLAMNPEGYYEQRTIPNLAEIEKAFAGEPYQNSSGPFDPEVSISEDGRLVAIRDQGYAEPSQVIIVSTATGKVLSRLPGQWCGFSPHGTLAVTTEITSVILWDAETGTRIREYKDFSGRVYFAGFSPDGKIIAATSDQYELRLWTVKSGVSIVDIETNGVRDSISFVPGGSQILTNLNELYTCELCSGLKQLVSLVPSHVSRPLTSSERNDVVTVGRNAIGSDRSSEMNKH
jgi:WD40 repeat protein